MDEITDNTRSAAEIEKAIRSAGKAGYETIFHALRCGIDLKLTLPRWASICSQIPTSAHAHWDDYLKCFCDPKTKPLRPYSWDINNNQVTTSTIMPSDTAIPAASPALDKPKIGSSIHITRSLIFYGPPGTGKTFTTRDRAVELAKPSGSEDYDQLQQNGRIQFITFHQSFSYEDFIEGIRPVLDDASTTPRYECRDGILKRMAIEAAFDMLAQKPDATSMSAAGASQSYAYKSKADIVQGVLRGDGNGWHIKEDAADTNQYVLIIDEINRGNISKIFGELITLIEPDKRLGGDNPIIATLPYSGDRFALPANLHIIGTMNSADKSIALVDLALRRRFEFEEIAPNFDLCKDMPQEMRDILNNLNDRIHLRKDRDHCIGHAYFMKVKDAKGFNAVFRKQIIPLLQEYFYNDWEGLRYVLGEPVDKGHFISKLKEADTAMARTKWEWINEQADYFACLKTNYKL